MKLVAKTKGAAHFNKIRRTGGGASTVVLTPLEEKVLSGFSDTLVEGVAGGMDTGEEEEGLSSHNAVPDAPDYKEGNDDLRWSQILLSSDAFQPPPVKRPSTEDMVTVQK
ncbi:hypothetical protein SKAU_G00022840 [Synaphobranchus kaupii]|uniref:Uncharacterized protein n=1 Tax=Synaphobranchus kaupii TaxID=118154 RepID=A0A9Q1JCD7_SYNKA|nr:hypothetical protein SKAU_G00022840 [Synaphobranchus kaupii]